MSEAGLCPLRALPTDPALICALRVRGEPT